MELIGEQGLSPSPLSLLDEIEADDRRTEPPQTAHEVEGRWRLEWSGSINCKVYNYLDRGDKRTKGKSKVFSHNELIASTAKNGGIYTGMLVFVISALHHCSHGYICTAM